MKLRLATLLLALAGPPAIAADPSVPKPVPTDAECKPLPALTGAKSAILPGETLRFELDAMGAKAGSMTMRVLPVKDGLLPLQVDAEASSFVRSLTRIKGTATSFVDPRTLRPRRYTERGEENQIRRHYDVAFSPKQASVAWRFNQREGKSTLRFPREAFDVAGVAYLARRLPMEEGQTICLDLYGMRRIWRLHGTIAKEKVTLPLGVFDAWRFSGEAVRLDSPRRRREIHLWFSDDDKRLPLAALGTTDLGAMRATLVGYERPGESATRIDDPKSLKW